MTAATEAATAAKAAATTEAAAATTATATPLKPPSTTETDLPAAAAAGRAGYDPGLRGQQPLALSALARELPGAADCFSAGSRARFSLEGFRSGFSSFDLAEMQLSRCIFFRSALRA